MGLMKWNIILLFVFCNAWAHAQVLMEEKFNKKGRFTEGEKHYVQQGVYHAYSDSEQYRSKEIFLFDTTRQYENFIAELKTEYIGGSDNGIYGLILRAKDRSAYYAVRITANGQYNVSYQSKEGLHYVVPWKTAENNQLIRKGVNYLKVYCFNDSMHLWANGKYLTSAVCDSSAKGWIGLTAGENVHVHFDDLRISAIKSGEGRYYAQPDDTEGDFKPDTTAFFTDNLTEKSKKWTEDADGFYESGYYTIQSPKNWKQLTIDKYVKDFSFEIRFRIHSWRSSGRYLLRFRYTYNGTMQYYDFVNFRDSAYQVTRYETALGLDTLAERLFIPSQKSRPFTSLRIDCKDSDIKISINDYELILISDQSVEPKTGTLEWFATGVHMDLLSYRIMLNHSESFGLSAKRSDCELLRIPAKTIARKSVATGDKPPDEPSDYLSYEEDASASVLITILIGVVSAGLLIYGIRAFYQHRKRRVFIFYCEKYFEQHLDRYNGRISRNKLMLMFHLPEPEIDQMLEKMKVRYNGFSFESPDGDVIYDFPDYFKSAVSDGGADSNQDLETRLKKLLVSLQGRVSVRFASTYFGINPDPIGRLLEQMVMHHQADKTDSVVYPVYIVKPEVLDTWKKELSS